MNVAAHFVNTDETSCGVCFILLNGDKYLKNNEEFIDYSTLSTEMYTYGTTARGNLDGYIEDVIYIDDYSSKKIQFTSPLKKYADYVNYDKGVIATIPFGTASGFGSERLVDKVSFGFGFDKYNNYAFIYIAVGLSAFLAGFCDYIDDGNQMIACNVTTFGAAITLTEYDHVEQFSGDVHTFTFESPIPVDFGYSYNSGYDSWIFGYSMGMGFEFGITQDYSKVYAFANKDIYKLLKQKTLINLKGKYFDKNKITYKTKWFNRTVDNKYEIFTVHLKHTYDYKQTSLLNKVKKEYIFKNEGLIPENKHKVINEIEYHQMKRYELIRFNKSSEKHLYLETINVKH